MSKAVKFYITLNFDINISWALLQLHLHSKLSTWLQTARHFRWPCAIFADTGVFKIRITILKSMRYVTFLWDFSQKTTNHQSNTKKQYLEIWFFLNMKFIKFHGIPWNPMELQKSSMEFHGTFWGEIKSSMEFHGVPWNSGVWKKFHGIPAHVIEIGALQVPWNSMELMVSVPWNSMEPIICY